MNSPKLFNPVSLAPELILVVPLSPLPLSLLLLLLLILMFISLPDLLGLLLFLSVSLGIKFV